MNLYSIRDTLLLLLCRRCRCRSRQNAQYSVERQSLLNPLMCARNTDANA